MQLDNAVIIYGELNQSRIFNKSNYLSLHLSTYKYFLFIHFWMNTGDIELWDNLL